MIRIRPLWIMRLEGVVRSQIISALVLGLLAIFFVAGCEDTNNSKLSRLDRQKGIGGLVLGDSLYRPIFNSHREQASDYDPLETTVQGHVSTAGMRVSVGERFLFGVERGHVSADALDGQIYTYTVRNVEIPSSRVEALEDSLIATFGEPTSALDSVYVTDGYKTLPVLPKEPKGKVLERAIQEKLVPPSAKIDSTRSVSLQRWEGQRVTMQFTNSDNQGFTLSIYDQKAMNTVHSIEREIDSTLRADRVSSIRNVGEFPLLTRKQNSLIEAEELEYSDRTVYVVPYEALRPFFGVTNRNLYGATQAIEARATFSPTSDSLSELIIQMRKSVDDPDSFRDEVFMTVGDVRESLESSMGSPALSTTTSTLEGDFRTLYWASTPFSIIAKEERIRDIVSVTFERTDRVGSDLFRVHDSNAWDVSPIFYLPWPDNERR